MLCLSLVFLCLWLFCLIAGKSSKSKGESRYYLLSYRAIVDFCLSLKDVNVSISIGLLFTTLVSDLFRMSGELESSMITVILFFIVFNELTRTLL